jgi:hypothetical protein
LRLIKTLIQNTDALFLHTSRYHVGGAEIIEFAEAHSHAPRQFLHMPPNAELRALLLSAKSLVLVDDEASTGNTFLNLSNACRALNPHIEYVHLATITNFMGKAANEALSQRFGIPVSIAASLSGEYVFTAGALQPSLGAAQVFEAHADRGANGDFGRLGLDRALAAPHALAQKLAEGIKAGEQVLVLGTGEFMHLAFLLGSALEALGCDVLVQSSTRSPILTWGAVSQALSFPDNYGEGVENYIYNVTIGQYDHVLVCHESPPNEALHCMAQAVGGRLFHFLSENHIEEISVR